MHTLYLSLYEINLQLNTDSQDILDWLVNDFSYFVDSTQPREVSFSIDIFLQAPPRERLPVMKASSQSINSVTYDDGDIRYNDYYGEVLSIYNYVTNKAEIYSLNLSRIHEIAYLLILSRTGEALDMNGFHKIHASGVSYKNCAFIMMMPMKGGKSTTFLNLLQKTGIEIISDDTPLINRSGIVFPFPLRLGIHEIPNDLVIDGKYITKIKREYYGEKFLINMQAFKNPISKPCSKIVLLNGVRYSQDTSQIIRCSKFSMIRPLLVHMVVGLGLPIILEYFLRFSIKDILLKTKILISRLYSGMALLSRAEVYTLELGHDQKFAKQILTTFIENYEK